MEAKTSWIHASSRQKKLRKVCNQTLCYLAVASLQWQRMVAVPGWIFRHSRWGSRRGTWGAQLFFCSLFHYFIAVFVDILFVLLLSIFWIDFVGVNVSLYVPSLLYQSRTASWKKAEHVQGAPWILHEVPGQCAWCLRSAGGQVCFREKQMNTAHINTNEN